MPKLHRSSYALIGAFATYFAVATFGALSARPLDATYFPSTLFFFGYSFLPCLASWLLVASSLRLRFLAKSILLLASLVLFSLIWHWQLKFLVDFALRQPDRQLEGLISNFYVFSHRISSRSLGLSALFLASFSIFWPKLQHRLSGA